MKITDENAQEFLRAYEDGTDAKLMAIRFGIHLSYVRRAVERAARLMGCEAPPSRRKQRPRIKIDISKEELLFLVQSCGPVLAAECIGVSRSTMWRHATGIGIKEPLKRDKKKYPKNLLQDIDSMGIKKAMDLLHAEETGAFP